MYDLEVKFLKKYYKGGNWEREIREILVVELVQHDHVTALV